MKLTIVLLVFVMGTIFTSLGQSTAPKELANLQAIYWGKLVGESDAAKNLNVKYLAALKRLKDSEAAKGDLDSVILVKQEMDAFGDGKGFDPVAFEKRTSAHKGVKKMQATYLASRVKIDSSHVTTKKKLAAVYEQRLQELKVEFTKAGRIDEAIAVNKEDYALPVWYFQCQSKTTIDKTASHAHNYCVSFLDFHR